MLGDAARKTGAGNSSSTKENIVGQAICPPGYNKHFQRMVGPLPCGAGGTVSANHVHTGKINVIWTPSVSMQKADAKKSESKPIDMRKASAAKGKGKATEA